MKKIISISLITVSALLIAGCGDGGGGGGGGNVPACTNGLVYDTTTRTCIVPNYPINPNNGPIDYYDYNKMFTYIGYGQTQSYNGDMKITNRGAYKAFLKESMAVCDRGTWGNYGISDCDKWTSGSFELSVRIDTNLRPSVWFRAYPQMDIFNYNFQIGFNGGGVAMNPLILNSGSNTLSLINQSKGMEIRANGSYLNGGGLRLIQIQIDEGTLADTNLVYELFYPYNGQPTKVATGILKRKY